MSVSIRNLNTKRKIKATRAKSVVQAVLKGEGKEHLSVSLLVCDDRYMQKMHLRYLGIDSPTDVLAFPMDDPSLDVQTYLGDCLVSSDTACRQAVNYKQSADQELALYMIHGVLHLLGYDDHSPEDRKVMRKQERRFCNIVNIRKGDLFR